MSRRDRLWEFTDNVRDQSLAIPTLMKLQARCSNDIEALVKINTADMLNALGLAGVRRGRRLLERLCRPPALRLARQVLIYDDLVGAAGLQVGAAWALGQFVRHVAVEGQAYVPRTGPLLIVANHPGLYDTAMLFTAIPRPDLRTVAADRPFLRALPNTSRYLISVTDDPSARMSVVRTAARHLRNGGALLTFPGGRIEPDPAVLPGAVAALGDWSESLAVFARLAPGLTVMPAVVSGVLSARALRHPLTSLRRSEAERHLMAAMLQVILPALHTDVARVAFGRPLYISGAVASGRSFALGATVTSEAQRLMEQAASPQSVVRSP